jgi:hypothetical protein
MKRQISSRGMLTLAVTLAVALIPVTSASASWKEQVLYTFQGGSDGQTPAGGVVFDKQGNLYGATQTGTVFQLASPVKKGDPWAETLLYTFKGKNGYNDGMQPSGGLVIDSSGNLYGVTAYGGTGGCILLGVLYGCGTVYEISPPQQKGGQWTEAILYSFQSGNDGYLPNGDLTFDKAGNLYGATSFGGGKGNTCDPYYQYCGTVFKLSPPKQKGGQWQEQVLHSFAGGTDGANPNGGLVLDGKGVIYGTAFIGGYNCPHNSNQGCGTVFKLEPANRRVTAWKETILYSFKGYEFGDGSAPSAGVFVDKSGHLYGTASQGGTVGVGIIFELAAGKRKNAPWSESILYSFGGGSDGGLPLAPLTPDHAGTLYGTTSAFGEYRGGTFYSLTVQGVSVSYKVNYQFGNSKDTSNPFGNITLRAARFFGVGWLGGAGGACQGGCGTVFEVSR